MLWTFCFFGLTLIWSTTATSVPNVVSLACERNPNLPYCTNNENDKRNEQRNILFGRIKTMEERNHSNHTADQRARDQPLSEKDRLMLIEIAESVERYKRDPFADIEQEFKDEKKTSADRAPAAAKTIKEEPAKESHNDSDLREKEGSEEIVIKEEGFVQEHDGSERKLKEKETQREAEEDTDEHPTRTRGPAEEYCDEYEQHFSFYCVGESSRVALNEERVTKFCPSYKASCPHKQITTSVSLTTWPRDPFTKPIGFQTLPSPVEVEESSEEEITSEEEELERKETYYKELKRRFPCKPDCDRSIFPHCTDECKCDYIYPAVQRFCNPPPLPLFLNTCRLWYNSCPKYAQYHYASQYIYSKAEKGKRIPGPLPVGSNPLPQAPLSRLAGQATRKQQYSDNPQSLRPLAQSSSTYVVPPPLPSEHEQEHTKPARHHKKIRRTKKERRRSSSRSHQHSHHSDRRYKDPRTLSQKELFRTLRSINALTADPVKTFSDPASLLSGLGGADGSEAHPKDAAASRPRAHQVNTFPVVPSDAAFGADDNTFKKFDGLTDSSGVLHRPRSRSPFSKPGLWEANPDNPHNRDHANKFFYYPRSVSVDWLNGQIAWGAHWAVPAAGVGGTDGFSTLHFPTIGTFLNIPDDYD